jgi:hypothetical protein
METKKAGAKLAPANCSQNQVRPLLLNDVERNLDLYLVA